MMRGAGRVVVSVVALVALGRTACAEEFAVELAYDVRFGPLPILAMELRAELGADRYRATSRLRTQGVIDRLYAWRSRAESRGRRVGATLQPAWHRSDGEYRRERRTVAIDYADGGAVRAAVAPLPAEPDDVVPDPLRQATVDPLTASLLTVAGDCRGVVPVFDGRRRYDLRLTALPPAPVPRARGAVWEGVARRCRATVEARAGYWRDDPRDDDEPPTLEYWIASPGAGLPALPVHLELRGARGSVGIVLVRVRPVDGAAGSDLAGRTGGG